MNIQKPMRGEVWDINFDPVVGHEQAGMRPALIVSVDYFNESPAELVVAIPFTRTERKLGWRVAVMPPEGGLTALSFIQCENVRSLSRQRLKRLRGQVSDAIMKQVEDRLRILMGL